MSIDRFKERISNMLFVTTFHERVTQLGRNMTNVMDASTSIKDSEPFKELLNVSFIFTTNGFFFFFSNLNDSLF